MSMIIMRKPRGRPKKSSHYPNITHMRVNVELKALLEAERMNNETLCETTLRLIRTRGQKLNTLTLEMETLKQLLSKGR